MRSCSSVRSLQTFRPKCHTSQMPNALTYSRRITVTSPTSPSLTLKASCGKPTTSNWATAQYPLHSAPSVKMATPSSNTIYSPPPPTFVTPLPSCFACGSSTPSLGSHLPTTRPLNWPAAQMTGGWSLSSPATTSQTRGCSTSWPRYMHLIASCKSSRWPAIRVAVASRGLTLNTIFGLSRPSTTAAPPVPMPTSLGFILAVVGHHSRRRVMSSPIIGTRGHGVTCDNMGKSGG